MPQRNTEDTPHRHSLIDRILETVFGPEDVITPRMDQQMTAEKTSKDIADRREGAMKETQEKIRRLTGKEIEVIPQKEADILAQSMLYSKNHGPEKVGSRDAERIVKSVRRHDGK